MEFMQSPKDANQSLRGFIQPLLGFIQRFIGFHQSLPDAWQWLKDANQPSFTSFLPKNLIFTSSTQRRKGAKTQSQIFLCAFMPLRLCVKN